MGYEREYFRINIFNVSIMLESENYQTKGKIRDISGNGVSVYLEEEMEENKLYLLRFSLLEKEFIIPSKIVRVVTPEEGQYEYIYAFKYEEIQQKIQDELLSVLFRIEILRKG